MNTLIYWFGNAVVVFLQALPLTWVARIGRAGGALAYRLDARHRRVTLKNLTMCFGGELSPAEIRALAKENFRRLGENYASAVKTVAMTFDQLRPHVEYVGAERLLPPRRVINAGGHFGNFELYARFSDVIAGYQSATTYRALNQPGLNRLMEKLRNRSGCLFFERRTGGPLLRAAMNQPAIILGLQIDQHGGDHGLRLPFLGHDCSTNPSPAVFALRYDCELYAAVCYRVGLAKWRLELGEKIPTHENGHPRPVVEIIRDVLRAQEAAVRRDPANWFWVHNRWKPAPKKVEGRRPDGHAMNAQAAGPRTPDAPRILVRGTNWLGDAVMTTPALLRLRERFPDAHIALLTPEKLRDLWMGHPAVNETISFAPGESIFSVGRKLRRVGSSRRDDRTAQRAVPTKFNLALVLPNSPRSAIEPWLAGIPKRIGYGRPWRNFFLTQAIAPRPDAVKMHKRSVAEIQTLISQTPDAGPQTPDPRCQTPATAHQIYEYLHLAAALGANPEPIAPQLFVAPEEVEAAKNKFGLEKMTSPVFGLNPGAEYGPAKRWPVERFIAAAREIQTRTSCVWLIFGGQNDTAVADKIQSAIGNRQSAILNLAGKTTLRELMSLLKLCRVLLTNDSGPMHVAAALGTPVVVPFGSTSPELTGPGLPGDPRNRLLKSNAPCSPCFLRECPIDFRCLNGISVERVVEAVLESKL